MNRHVRIAESYSSAGTRERGKRVYPELLKAADDASDLTISFEAVEFVSPSFLDETVIRLIEEDPSRAERISVTGLQPFATRVLRVALSRLGVQREVVQTRSYA